MKTLLRFLLPAVLLAAAGLLRAAEPQPDPAAPATKAQVDVIYFEPKHFTDIADTYPDGTEGGIKATLDTLKKYIVKQSTRVLPAGYHLIVTVSDIDLAGEFEPWRGGTWDQIRVVKDIYPPRIKLAFRLIDPSNNIVAQGERDLKDLAFLSRLSINLDDPLRHEKDLIDDWVSNEFRRSKIQGNGS